MDSPDFIECCNAKCLIFMIVTNQHNTSISHKCVTHVLAGLDVRQLALHELL